MLFNRDGHANGFWHSRRVGLALPLEIVAAGPALPYKKKPFLSIE
jgi:hypothetical protein